MEQVSWKKENDALIIAISGRIDSVNAAAVEKEIRRVLEETPSETLLLDCGALEYASSAGLRIILRLKQEIPDTRLVNVQPAVYEVLEMTGFTEMMSVEKAYRVISVEGCEVIGQGANGKVYRIDRDTILKAYHNPDSLEEIRLEREMARLAFIQGIPTAIPYDVVRLEGGGYGAVYELLNATSFAKLLASGEKKVDEMAERSVRLLKLIHSKEMKPDIMPDMRAVAINWAEFLEDYLPAELYEKLHGLVESVPTDYHMLHGDYHVKNVMLQNDEELLIDMDTLCYGHPIFELGSMFNAYKGYGATDPTNVETFLGITNEMADEFWRKSLSLYLGTQDEARLREVENKAKIIGFTRIMRRTIRRNGFDTPEGRRVIENAKNVLTELVPVTDTLLF